MILTPEQQTELSQIVANWLNSKKLITDQNGLVVCIQAIQPSATGESLASAPKFQDEPIEKLALSIRAKNVLSAANIKTVGEVAKLGYLGFVQLRNAGNKTAREVRTALIQFGLKLSVEWKLPGYMNDNWEPNG